MGAYLIYLQLEIKKALKVMPRLFAGAIVLIAILGAIAFSASKVLYDDELIGRIQIGVVLPADDILAETALRMLASLESVKSVCDFRYMDEESGMARITSGDLHALMLVPEGFVKGVISGENTPLKIVLPDDQGIEAMIFKELADSGARTLSVGQASIYAMDEMCIAYEVSNEIARVEEELNRIYLAYSLPREDYFRYYNVSAIEDVTVAEYYGISAAVLLLLYCGIPLASFCEPKRAVMVKKLQGIGINIGLQILSQLIAVALLLMIVSGVFLVCLSCFGIVSFQMIYIPVMALVCVTIASLIVSVYTITNRAIVGVMCLFFLSTCMVFLSGGLIPSLFLPEMVRELKNFVPTTPLAEILKSFVGVEISGTAAVWLFLWGAGCYLAAIAGRRRL